MHKPELILLCGLPGSGKTGWAEEWTTYHVNTIHLSSDAIREELWGDASIQKDPDQVFDLMQRRAVDALNNGKNVVYDATALTRKDRAHIIAACPKFAKISVYIIWAPIEVCIKRDAARERSVGETVINRMVRRFQMPFYDEGIDKIGVVNTSNIDTSLYVTSLRGAMEISHDNPHHTLQIGVHCDVAADYALSHGYDRNIWQAAFWHDVGKPYVKEFKDAKGNASDVAHFYSHQNVGAYLICGCYDMTPEIPWLVSTHMEPFLNSKYYKNLPPYLKKMVDQLHEADLAAH